MAPRAHFVARPLSSDLSVILLVLSALAPVSTAPAQECLDPTGSWGGDRRVSQLAADGDRVVLGTGPNLLVGTVGNGGRIVEGGSLALPVGSRGFDVSGDLAAVPLSGARVWLVDVSDLELPRLAGRVPGITGTPSVAIRGRTVLVADYPEGLAVVDATDPAVPLVSRLPLPGARVVAFAGDRAVVVATEEHDDHSVTETLHVVELSGPAPAVVGSTGLPSMYAELAATAEHAFVAWTAIPYPAGNAEPWLQRVSLADPAHPALGASREIHWGTHSVLASNGMVLVAGEDLEIFRDDEALTPLGGDPAYSSDVAVAGGWYLVADSEAVRSLFLSDPAHPRVVATRPHEGSRLVKEVAVVGDVVVILESPRLHELNLGVLDLTNPNRPLEVGSLPVVSGSAILAAAQDVALLLEGHAFRVVDVSDPTRPRQVGDLTIAARPRSIAAAGHLAAVVDETPAVRFIDLADPTRPREVASHPTSTWDCRVFFDGPRALVADPQSGEEVHLHHFDLARPDLPFVRTTLVSGLPVGSWDGRLFVGPQPLEVWDVDRSSLEATFETEGRVGSVAISGGWAFAPHLESVFWGTNWWGQYVYIHYPRLSAVRLGREPEGALEGSTVLFGQSVRVPPWLAPDGEHLVIMGSDLGLAVLDAGACETLPPEARFEWWPQAVAAGQDVRFRDLSIGLPSAVRWSFGDGGSSDDPSPVHVFTTPGRHSVTLEVTNLVGSDAVTMEVVVGGVRGARGRFGRP